MSKYLRIDGILEDSSIQVRNTLRTQLQTLRRKIDDNEYVEAGLGQITNPVNGNMINVIMFSMKLELDEDKQAIRNKLIQLRDYARARNIRGRLTLHRCAHEDNEPCDESELEVINL